MATLRVKMTNASRKPLADQVDVDIIDMETGSTAHSSRAFDGKKTLAVSKLRANTSYRVQVFPMRHRPVGAFVLMGGGSAQVELAAPVHPDRAIPKFPAFAALPQPLQDVLNRSNVESSSAVPPATGKDTYDQLDNLQKAGLLNLFAKMTHTATGGSMAWEHVTDLYRVRGDRIFANVDVPFRDAVKTEVAAKTFEKVSGALHTPPAGFEDAGSFKTRDHFGNLQLTFFSDPDQSPPAFKVDADIDDANGIGHVFQVLRNFLTDSDTHPYDIHEILTFHQSLDTLYELTA